jgi:lysophospholipase L1-like esterase
VSTLDTLALIALGPLLLAQGKYTRLVTPKLPEPPGERTGSSGSGPALRLLILGDSAAAGVGVQAQSAALAGQLVARISANCQVDWELVAQSGLNTREVIDLVEKLPPQRFDAVLISVGVNDVTGGVSGGDWCAGLNRLIELLREKFGARRIILSRIPPINRFPALPQPLRWYLGRRAERFNRLMEQQVRQQPGCVVLDLGDAPVEQMMAADGFHPGPSIYALWADGAAALLLPQPGP